MNTGGGSSLRSQARKTATPEADNQWRKMRATRCIAA